ncbi:hypothetical protein L596_008731 [Steinernema carpocapsae]|uniref:G-protein coupled receptors family 1 profile domain-containing protein n=1 Tax=Steinernema carpocapsae TaxID=34508 RepID=A0A4V6A6D6_STECR|nr:hypothetical protein L596_008731 [Steinernema carpocapsae]
MSYCYSMSYNPMSYCYSLLFKSRQLKVRLFQYWSDMNAFIGPLESAFKSYVEFAINLISTTVALVVFVPYFKQRKSKNFIGPLLIYLATCTFYGVMHTLDSISHILQIHKINAWFFNDAFVPGHWYYMTLTLSTNLIFVSGPALALDRFCIMTAPFKYSHWKLSQKFSILAVLICVCTIALFYISLIVLPYDGPNIISASLIKNKLLIGFDVSLMVEFVVHILFFIQYWRFVRRQKTINPTTIKAVRITLVQIVSQTIFCMIPKILFRGNLLFSKVLLLWILRITMYYAFLLSIHVLLTCSFTLYTLCKHSSSGQKVVSIAQNSVSNSAKASMR